MKSVFATFSLTALAALTALFVTACGGAPAQPEGAAAAQAPCEGHGGADKPCDQPCDGEKKAGGHHEGPCDPAKCPRAVEGTTVTAENTADGAALIFKTTGDVAEVQKRAAALAAAHATAHEPGCKCDACKCGECKCGAEHVPATATAENIEGGAKIVFKPAKAEDVAKLQAMIAAHAAKAAAGPCHDHHGEAHAAGCKCPEHGTDKPCNCGQHGPDCKCGHHGAGDAGSQPSSAPASAP